MIHFGTSGWRSIIAEDFTFENVRRVIQAIATHIRSQPELKRPVVVGYDSRFLSPEFAKTAAEVLSRNGLQVLFSKDFVPTPVVSFQVMHQKAAGGVNFTASHNPSEYNGIKFNMANGAPSSPEVTKIIENYANGMSPTPAVPAPYGARGLTPSPASREREDRDPIFPLPSLGEGGPKTSGARGVGDKPGKITIFDPRPAYMAKLRKMIDVSALKKAKLKVGVDDLYGTGKGYLDAFMQDAGCRTTVLHAWRDVTFGGQSPEPAESQLAELV